MSGFRFRHWVAAAALAPLVGSATNTQADEAACGGRERAGRAPGERAGGVLIVAGDSYEHCRTEWRRHDNSRDD
jgi:hypothetical protein